MRGASVIKEKLNPVAGNDSPLLVSLTSVLFNIDGGKKYASTTKVSESEHKSTPVPFSFITE